MEDTFNPPSKQIYSYNNGEKVVRADPLLIQGKLAQAAIRRGKSIANIIASANKTDLKDISDIDLMDAWASVEMLADIATESFDLVPFNPATGNGADMAHAIGLVDHYYRWCEKKNQQPDLLSTSSAHATSTSATPPTTATSSV